MLREIDLRRRNVCGGFFDKKFAGNFFLITFAPKLFFN